MAETLLIPFQLNPHGQIATTTDPARIVYQRILDLLVTSRWERVHRVDHGCDLMAFLYSNPIEHILATKAAEIKNRCNLALIYGEVVQVQMIPLEGGPGTTVQVNVLFRVYEGGELERFSETFTINDEELL